MDPIHSRLRSCAAALSVSAVLLAVPLRSLAEVKFAVSFPSERSTAPLDGRMLLLLSTNGDAEPRFQVSDGPSTQLVFGIDVDGLEPGAETVIDASAFGYPLRSLAELPAGEYYVQALLHRYETFRPVRRPHRQAAHGPGRRPALERRAGQSLQRSPEDRPRSRQDRSSSASSSTRRSRPSPRPRTRSTSATIKIQSELLTEVLGTADVPRRLPPPARGLRRASRRPLSPDHLPRPLPAHLRRLPGDAARPGPQARLQRALPHRRLQPDPAGVRLRSSTRNGPGQGFPRVIVMEIQHANPYYDDSYAVNSANLGPYGDAIVRELIPYIEKKFRGLGQGWARFLYGGSTGGWEALAAQVFYPDEFNGCFAACPDPIDFRAYTIVNIYEHQNAYYVDSPWKRTPRPGLRNYLGEVSATLEEANHRELALGTHGRSGDQWDIWQAVFGPVGADGYPKPIWDKLTGEIDRERRRLLEGALRSRPHPPARLEDARPQAPGQDPHLRRRHGQLLSEQRRLPGGSVPREHQGPLLRRRHRLRRPGRALLERRPRAAERDLAPPLSPDVSCRGSSSGSWTRPRWAPTSRAGATDGISARRRPWRNDRDGEAGRSP